MRKYKERIKEIWRYPYRLYMKSRLQNHDFEIISSNCIGGILYHDVGEQFRTPTINLIIPEFLKFRSNLSVYLNYPLEPGRITKEGYPCCMCGDIEIIGVHYRNQEHLIHDWSKRVKRVTGKHIFVISTDNFIKTEEDMCIFDSLPYPKVCFSAKENKKYKWLVYLPEFKGKSAIGDSLRYCTPWGTRIFEKYFDCVNWLNSEK